MADADPMVLERHQRIPLSAMSLFYTESSFAHQPWEQNLGNPPIGRHKHLTHRKTTNRNCQNTQKLIHLPQPESQIQSITVPESALTVNLSAAATETTGHGYI
jgi:hypothetical protein